MKLASSTVFAFKRSSACARSPYAGNIDAAIVAGLIDLVPRVHIF